MTILKYCRKFVNKFIEKINYIRHSIIETIFVLLDSRFLIKKNDKVLFLDLGANIGQGYSWFSKFFKGENIDFELFEPNPYCYKKLKNYVNIKNKAVITHNLGVSTISGKVKFYGLKEEGDIYSLSGSIVKNHNSIHYKTKEENAIEIETINLGKFLINKSKTYDKIIIKMDIEGAEVEILEQLISTEVANLIDILYVEFHSQYQVKSKHSRLIRVREKKIIKSLKEFNNLYFRLWH
tara:strand:+ start:293 stop:1003 length:711 start_codon:yes stop_codon:yes gene_type:complete